MSATEAIRFPVAGMTCGSCVNRITRAVRRLDGVTKVDVDLRRGTATVRRESALVSNAALAQAVEAAGYRTDPDRAESATAEVSRGLLARLLGR